ncbi:MAG: DUF1194 domain-containing protein [Hyphomicrobiaceae bacterium]|nr:DUF1194 domain-containing protein [Hyphomicrobiaceae bacterium]
MILSHVLASFAAARAAVFAACLAAAVLIALRAPNAGGALPEVDTALLLAVDVSNSVDDKRYYLQMEGIAKALEDPGVISAITNGPQGSILFSIMTWSDRTETAIPWVRIGSAADAKAVADRIRRMPRIKGQFTCVSRSLRTFADKVVPQIPAKANRTVIDVSGDGREDCNPDEPVMDVRDELVESKVIINGLPILDGSEAATIEDWYKEHVQGGNGSFVIAADGYQDFERAIRQKFIVEISDYAPAVRPTAQRRAEAR